MINVAGIFAVAVALAAAIVAPASAAMVIGEAHAFTMDDPTEGTANYLLKQKYAERYFVTGGTIKRLAGNKYLICGYAIDRRSTDQSSNRPAGFVIISDRTADHAKVMAPLTNDAQVSRGCWPSERQRLSAAMKAFENSVQGASSQANSGEPNQ